jgi:hypothetical protein
MLKEPYLLPKYFAFGLMARMESETSAKPV